MSSKAYAVMRFINPGKGFHISDPKIKSYAGLLLVYDDKKTAEKENPGYEIMEIEVYEDQLVQ